MSQLIKERVTAKLEGDFVVFLIGMRINRWWKPHRWLPVARAMGCMLKELYAHPELGLLSHEMFVGRTFLLVQYWRSVDQLMEYAVARNSEHLPAWRDFNRKVGNNGDVGIYHETYAIRPGSFETVYVNMPRFGLGKSGELVPATGHMQQARGRMKSAA